MKRGTRLADVPSAAITILSLHIKDELLFVRAPNQLVGWGRIEFNWGGESRRQSLVCGDRRQLRGKYMKRRHLRPPSAETYTVWFSHR